MLLHFDLGSRSNLNNCDSTCKLGKTFLQLFAVEIGGGCFELTSDLSDTGSYHFLVSCAVNDDCIFLCHLYLMGGTELSELGILELESKLVGDNLATGKNGDIAEHFLTSVAKAGCLDRYAGKGASELVKDNGGECFTLDVLSYDKELFTGLNNLLEEG